MSASSPYSRYGRFFYDAEGERVVFEEEIFEGDQETAAYDEYFFFKQASSFSSGSPIHITLIHNILQNYMLRYNRMTKQCFRMPLDRNFTRVEVPTTAQFVDSFVIGTNAIEKFGLTVNVWEVPNGPNGELKAVRIMLL